MVIYIGNLRKKIPTSYYFWVGNWCNLPRILVANIDQWGRESWEQQMESTPRTDQASWGYMTNEWREIEEHQWTVVLLPTSTICLVVWNMFFSLYGAFSSQLTNIFRGVETTSNDLSWICTTLTWSAHVIRHGDECQALLQLKTRSGVRFARFPRLHRYFVLQEVGWLGRKSTLAGRWWAV